MLKENLAEDSQGHWNSMVEVKFDPPPRMVMDMEELKFVRTIEKTSAHEISLYDRITDDEVTTFYFKDSGTGECGLTLEALCGGYSSLFSPAHVTDTRIAHREFQYIGVLSKEVPGFTTSRVDGLKDDVLDTGPLDRMDITVLEDLYDEFMVIDSELQRLQRCKKRIDLMEDGIEKKNKRAENLATRKRIRERMNTFYDNLESQYDLSDQDFDKYRILKGHGIAFVNAIIKRDADFHRNNLNKYGYDLDHGLGLWTFHYQYEPSNLNRNFRCAKKKKYDVSSYDIQHLPNMRDAKFFVWPTRTCPDLDFTFPIPSEITEKLYSHFNFSINMYREEEVHRYRRLETNRYFIHAKYARFLRYMLVPPDIYSTLAQEYVWTSAPIPPDFVKNLVDNMKDHYEHTRQSLLRLDEFHEFFHQYGDREVKRYIDEIRQFSHFDQNFQKKLIKSIYEQLAELLKQTCSSDQLGAIDLSPPESDDEKAWDEVIHVPVDRVAIDFTDIKKLTLYEMKSYQRGGLFGVLRHHKDFAREIVQKLETDQVFSPNPRVRIQMIDASNRLYDLLCAKRIELEEAKSGKETGKKEEMLLLLGKLTEMIEGSIEFIRRAQSPAFGVNVSSIEVSQKAVLM